MDSFLLEISHIAEVANKYLSEKKEDIFRDLKKAFLYAQEAHKNTKRFSWDLYISHPISVAKELVCLEVDKITLQAALLHDVLDEVDYSKERIKEDFWTEIAQIVYGVDQIGKIKYRWEKRQVEVIRRSFVHLAKDPRIILIRLCDRVHNLQTLSFHPDIKKQKRIAQETLEIYAPIAHRLGIHTLKNTLETLSFSYVYPEEFKDVSKKMDKFEKKRETFIRLAEKKLKKIITLSSYEIKYRIKSPYSVFRKFQRDEIKSMDDINDIFALRIIVPEVQDCYRVLWEIHALTTHVSHRFRDYISHPKANNYQSIHTTILGLLPESRSFSKKPVEVQIRTQDMDKNAELGIAAHFHYSESWTSLPKNVEDWIFQMKDMLGNIDADEYMDFFEEKMKKSIYVFSPKGGAFELPVSASVLDFSYAVHTQLGHETSLSLVNGKVVPIDFSLSNGDIVEIVRDKKQTPREFWLSFVKTKKAQQNIRSYLLEHNREKIIENGKVILDAYMQSRFQIWLDKDGKNLCEIIGRNLTEKEIEKTYIQVGNLSLRPGSFFRKNIYVIPKKRKKHVIEDEKKEDDTIIVGKQEDITYELAGCCTPKFPEPIIALSKKGGIIIHALSCKQLSSVNPDRVLPAYWEAQGEKNLEIRFWLFFQKTKNPLPELTHLFSQMNLVIEDIEMKNIYNKKDGELLYISLYLISLEEDYFLYSRLIEKIKKSFSKYVRDEFISVQTQKNISL